MSPFCIGRVAKLDKAYTSYKQVMDKSLDFINRYFPPMSEAESQTIGRSQHRAFNGLQLCTGETSATNPNVVADFFNYHLATKALLPVPLIESKESIRASNDKQLVTLYEQWQATKSCW